MTRENHRIMATLEALVITTLLTVGSSGVYGNDGELSTTTGDTVLIPCDFGEGTIRNVYWYYNDGTGPVKILTLFKGNVSIDAAYGNRASLHDDSSTLILTDIMVKDEGTYRCDVDREGQTAVPNINTELHVFSLTAETLPEITQCTEVGKSSACNVHSNTSIAMICALNNVYPANDAKLVWYREEQRVHSTDSSKENDDGTFHITGEIEVSESGNLICNATFLTAQGTVNTAVLVAVTITPDPGNNLKKRYIAIGIGVVLAVVVLAGVIVYFICCSRGRGGQKYSQVNMVLDPENGRTSSNLSGKREVTSEEITKLAKLLPEGKFVDLFNALGFDYNYHQKILKKHQKDNTAAAAELLEEWKAKMDGYTNVLDEAMKKAEVGGLIPKYKKVIEGSNIPSTTGATVALTTPSTSPTEKGSNGAPTPSTATAATSKPIATTSSTSKPKAGSSPTTAAAAATPSPSTTIVSTPASTTTSSTTVATLTTAADAVAPPTAAAAAATTTTTTTASTASTTSNASTNAGGDGQSQPNINGNTNSDRERQQSKAPTSSTTKSAATSNGGIVSDEKLDILAAHVPNDKYALLCVKLGKDYNASASILGKHRNDYTQAIRECMSHWKNRTGGSLDDLKKILQEVELGGFVMYIQ